MKNGDDRTDRGTHFFSRLLGYWVSMRVGKKRSHAMWVSKEEEDACINNMRAASSSLIGDGLIGGLACVSSVPGGRVREESVKSTREE